MHNNRRTITQRSITVLRRRTWRAFILLISSLKTGGFFLLFIFYLFLSLLLFLFSLLTICNNLNFLISLKRLRNCNLKISTFFACSKNVNIANALGNTALHVAALNNSPECAKLLLRNGASLEAGTILWPHMNRILLFYSIIYAC